jgi:hypothetical protein
VGLVPTSVNIGGHNYAFLGGQTLNTVCKHGDYGQASECVGECYIHGLMDGEVMGWLNEGSATLVFTARLSAR